MSVFAHPPRPRPDEAVQQKVRERAAFDEALRRQAVERERENREAWRIEREKLARADREDIPTD